MAGWGRWSTGGDGRPEVHLEGPGGDTEPDVWHLVGAPGLLATAHRDGSTSLYLTASGMVRLADRSGAWSVDGEAPEVTSVAWTCEGARWTGSAAGVPVVREVRADPVAPVLRIRWEVAADRPVRIGERWELAHLPLLAGALMSRPVPVPSTHRGWRRGFWRVAFAVSGASRRLTDAVRAGLGRRWPLVPEASAGAPQLRWRSARPHRAPRRPVLVRRDLPVVELTVVTDGVAVRAEPGHVEIAVDPTGAEAPAVVELELRALLGQAGGPASVATTTGGADAGAVSTPGEVDLLRAGAPDADAAVLAREAQWHAHQLRGLRVPDAWTGRTFVMQGSAYAFVHGLHGAPRDEAFVAVALAPVDPATAREAVLSIAAMVAPDGSLRYAHTGFGRTVSGGIHAAPTDLPLFFAWAAAEYVAATGDRSVLAERPLPFGRRPDPDGERSVSELLAASLQWFCDGVGTGPHGLVRVGSGDWSDPISLMVRRRRDFHRTGESTFNTAMAVQVLPGLAWLLAEDQPLAAASASQLAADLDGALERAWNGRWYLRGWDGRGGPIGAEHCFLDAQVWALVAGHGGTERGASLTAAVGELLDDPSPIGPTILDRPHPIRLGLLADGWDCNGGVWAALGGLAAWGFAQHDPGRAWATLRRQSMLGHAEAYPELWAGRWSGPDARNAWFGDRPGETFVHPATPMAEYPVMNSNAHAGPLLGLLRAAGIDPLRSATT